MKFYSDNTATACPEILEAISLVNRGHTIAYGDDEWTQRLDAEFSRYFDTPVRVFPVTTGTAANALALSTISPPYGAIYAHEFAHVVRDECGAVELFTGGARVTPISGPSGKLPPAALEATLDAVHAGVHSLQPASVTLTQATEFGTVYRVPEITALTSLAHSRGLKVHMDGARYANAVVFLECHPGDITWRAGIDVLSFGATKNGAIAAEAVVFFNLDLVKDFELRRKRAGHLLSKSRYAAAQLLAYIESGAWLRNAQRANRLARQISDAARSHLLHPVEANELFIQIGEPGKEKLRALGFEFYDWGSHRSGEARLVVSWDQPEESVAALCKALRELG